MNYLLITLLLTINYMVADSITSLIDTPGQYFYGSDIFADPTDLNDAIITVSADNVIVDLGDYLYSQAPGNQVGGLVGIRIITPHKDIQIRGGRIAGLTGAGIEIQEGCSNVNFDDMVVSQCDAGGVLANGTVSQNIAGLSLQNCVLISCTGVNGAPAQGAHLKSVQRSIIENCILSGNDGASTASGYGLYLENCFGVGVNNSTFSSNGGFLEAAGAYVLSSTQCFFRECVFNLNVGRSSNSAAFGAGAILNHSDECQFDNGEFSGNNNLSAQGYGLRSSLGSRNILQNSILQNNRGSTNAFGVEFVNETKSECIESYIRGNRATSAWGMRLTGLCSNCVVHKNEFTSNNGTTSFGLQDQRDPSTSVVTANRAFDHSTNNYDVEYPGIIVLPRIMGDLNNTLIGLPSNVGGLLDNVDIEQ